MTTRLAILFAACLLATACGQKGDLYLPEPAPQAESAAQPVADGRSG